MKTKIYSMRVRLMAVMMAVCLHGYSQDKVAVKKESIIEEKGNTSWIHFKQKSNIHPDAVFTQHKSEFGLSDFDEMKKYDDYTSPLTGITIQRFQQYANGIMVHGARMNVYSKDGVATKTNGRIVKNLTAPAANLVSEETALQLALDYLPEKEYAWNDAARVERYRQKNNNPSATLYPTGELVYMYKTGDKDFDTDDYVLCRKFDVEMMRTGSATVYVNAMTGEIVNTISLSDGCDPTNVTLPFNGFRTVYTSVQGGCSPSSYFEVYEDCGVNIIVTNHDFGAGATDPICNASAGNTWANPLGGLHGDAMQVFWSMRNVFGWYLSNFTWNSFDNGGSDIDCSVFKDYGADGGNNANHSGGDFYFGYGTDSFDPDDSYTCLDIVGHEFTHGVDAYTADLDYVDESGALDESFADIFGEAIEKYTDDGIDTAQWLVGEDRGTSLRSFADPNSKGDPDTYLGTNWCDYTNGSLTCTDEDNGGVHTNSGVQNHFFYMLTEGKSGTNDNGDYYSVSGIGLADAIDIAFAAHTYLWSTAEYIDSRDAWLEAAKDLFGNCSNQMIQVGNAWHAVGVGSQSPYYDNLLFNTTLSALVSNNTQQAINEISTLNDVDINSISGSFEVQFYTGRFVTLTPGFDAPSGCAFRARINPCSITLHTPVRHQAPLANDFAESKAASSFDENIKVRMSPNPFTEKTTLEITLSNEEEISVSVFDAIGKKLGVFDTKQLLPSGTHQINIDGSQLSAGIYHVVISTSQGKKIVQKLSRIN